MNPSRLFFVLLVSFLSCTKNNSHPVSALTSNKTVEFSVFGEKDYSDSSFSGIDADVYLALYKISYLDQKVEKIWDSTFARKPLHLFPQLDQPIITTRSITAIRDHLEYVSAHYAVTYRGRYISSFSNADPLEAGNQHKRVFVGL